MTASPLANIADDVKIVTPHMDEVKKVKAAIQRSICVGECIVLFVFEFL